MAGFDGLEPNGGNCGWISSRHPGQPSVLEPDGLIVDSERFSLRIGTIYIPTNGERICGCDLIWNRS
jgi:hypothetical protein